MNKVEHNASAFFQIRAAQLHENASTFYVSVFYHDDELIEHTIKLKTNRKVTGAELIIQQK